MRLVALLLASVTWPIAAIAGPHAAILAKLGFGPSGVLLAGQNGSIFGETQGGGSGGYGTIYALTPPGTGNGAWKSRILHAFTGAEGAVPFAGLSADAAGNLYGTAAFGGGSSCAPTNGAHISGCGVVFELSPQPNTQSYTLQVLYAFQGGSDGANPLGLIVLDAQGNLFTTTYDGGGGNCATDGGTGCGTIIELSPPGITGSAWSENVLFRYGGGAFGANATNLALDASGAVIAVAQYGGAKGVGTVLRLAPPATKGAAWHASLVHSFTGRDGAYPVNAPVFDAAGNAYLGTVLGGAGGGTLIRLTPPASGNFPWARTVLRNFNQGPDGGAPEMPVVLPGGNLLVATYDGGVKGAACANGCGTIIELSPPATGNIWQEKPLYRFPAAGVLHNAGSAAAQGNMLLDASGAAILTTVEGQGSVVRISGLAY